MIVPGSASALLLRTADTGYKVERSLRFNSSDSAYLSRTPASAGNRKTWTWAGWVKRSVSSGTYQVVLEAAGGAAASTRTFIMFVSNSLWFWTDNGSTCDLRTSQVFRDPSSWYHIIVAVDTTQATSSNRVKIYVNGNQVTSFSTATYPSLNLETSVNTATSHLISKSYDNYYADGLLADVFFIDGQALTPSSFTEVSATTGQLIPKAYTGTFTGNSFWLKFADNSAATATTLGKDNSGLGNNWTPNNLSVYQGTTQGVNLRDSSRITLSGGKTGATDVTKLLDGVLNYTDTFYNGNGSYISYSVSGLSVGSTIYIRYWNAAEAAGQTITATCDQRDSGGTQIAGTAVSQTWTQGQKWNDGSGYIAQVLQSGVSTIRLTFSNNSNVSYGWGVGEIEFLNGSGNDSLVDTPTSYGTDDGLGGSVRGNYCTLNPINSTVTLSNGNLDVSLTTTTAFRGTNGTIGVSSGKWYWEYTATSTAGSSRIAYIGVGLLGVAPNDNYGNVAGSYIYQQNDGTKRNNGTNTSYGASFTTNDVIGVALDADNLSLTFYKNGVSQGTAFSGMPSGTYFPTFGAYADTTVSGSFNFGQRPFAYTAPSGFKALVDTNIPVVIAKPSEVMDVVTYAGNGTSQSLTLPGAFSPDFVWIKARNNSQYWHEMHDIVRGAGKLLSSNATQQETTNNALTSFDSSGFTVSTQGNTQAGTNFSGVTYVAWAFDAGSNTVSNTQGSITSQVRANASAGFSIVTYTASAGATIGHGLGVAPSLIIAKSRTSGTATWAVYHSVLGRSQYLLLNATDAAGSLSNYWGTADPTSTVFGVYSTTAASNNTGNMVAYCFAPVAGYSSAGSFVTNGSADNSFVYTGFRPRFILYKRTDGASSWGLLDTARSTYNVANTYLLADSSAAEATATQMDVLSNGFKMRSADFSNGQTWIYFAWAENPFQYARAR